MAFPPWHRLCLVAFVLQLCFVVTVSACAWLDILPTSLPAFPHFDLIGHATLFGLLGALLDGALRHRPVPLVPLHWLGLGPVIVLSVAGIEEVLQYFGTYRTASILDYSADVVGVILFTAALRALSRRYDRPGVTSKTSAPT